MNLGVNAPPKLPLCVVTALTGKLSVVVALYVTMEKARYLGGLLVVAAYRTVKTPCPTPFIRHD